MIYVECDADIVLVRSLTTGQDVQHKPGKSRVCSQLERQTRCKGMVDEDPTSTQPPYVDRLKKARREDDSPEYALTVLHDNSNHNRLILLCPRLEEWLLQAAVEAEIDIRKYHLPNNPKGLHTELTLKRKRHMDNFKRLLEDMRDCGRLKALKRLLETSC